MSERRGWPDGARIAANLTGAVFQVLMGAFGALFGLNVGTVADENRSLIIPAGWAFLIWTPIFLLCAVYAAYQALPAHGSDPLLRRIGWATAAAFIGNGVWEILFPNRSFAAAQVVLFLILACLAVAYVRLQRGTHAEQANRAERWLVAPTVGLIFGWLSAAAATGLMTTLVALDRLNGGMAEEVAGAVTLFVCAGFAAGMILLGREGPPLGYFAYALAVGWALVAIVVEQRSASGLTSGTAMGALAAVLVALAVAASHRFTRKRSGPRTRLTTERAG